MPRKNTKSVKKKKKYVDLEVYGVLNNNVLTPMFSMENLIEWLRDDHDPEKEYDQETINRIADFFEKELEKVNEQIEDEQEQ